MTESPSLVAVYADESCLGNGREGENPGGAAGVIEYRRPTGDLVRFDYWLSEPATTNNRMALRSAVEALRVLSRKGGRFRVLFTSDSNYLILGMREWVDGWAARGWRRKTGALENADLWKEGYVLRRQHEIRWQWVRGHAGHPQNEYANYLAVRAAREQTTSHGAVPSGFDAWLGQRRDSGQILADPATFPDVGLFRDSPPAASSDSPVEQRSVTSRRRRRT